MPHCYSVTVDIDGRETQLCTTHVPGNEALSEAVLKAQQAGTAPRAPTKTEVDRAVEYHLRNQGRPRPTPRSPYP